ncbi:cytoskeletal protein CcmA (bactofilin family) [Cereibacter ovatus]|uniref:Cytoskeletal protein CcmA (Bactofilin family) n=1 Tax=Cereibacter ovatus TaxID=439529 RepID=A0A285D5J0_9RHOB|nr:polymer-forming cytoskeletal protein [Cereibacter ovatus]SNX75072.1 cytoskeletal protein CcmA (bactofilin family) [Cereibacter ovatus]
MQNRPAEPAPQRTGSNASKSTLGPDLKIVGDITSAGSIEVMGEIEGTITSRDLTIGPEGRASGTFSAENIEVRGRLDGRVSCSSLVVRSAARVTSDVTYRALVIENGASVEGRFKLTKG